MKKLSKVFVIILSINLVLHSFYPLLIYARDIEGTGVDDSSGVAPAPQQPAPAEEQPAEEQPAALPEQPAPPQPEAESAAPAQTSPADVPSEPPPAPANENAPAALYQTDQASVQREAEAFAKAEEDAKVARVQAEEEARQAAEVEKRRQEELVKKEAEAERVAWEDARKEKQRVVEEVARQKQEQEARLREAQEMDKLYTDRAGYEASVIGAAKIEEQAWKDAGAVRRINQVVGGVSSAPREQLVNSCGREECDENLGEKVCIEYWELPEDGFFYTKPGRLAGKKCTSKIDTLAFKDTGRICETKRLDECFDTKCDTNLGELVCLEKWQTSCQGSTSPYSFTKAGRVTGERCGGNNICAPRRLQECAYTRCDPNLGHQVCMEIWTDKDSCNLVANENRPGAVTDQPCKPEDLRPVQAVDTRTTEQKINNAIAATGAKPIDTGTFTIGDSRYSLMLSTVTRAPGDYVPGEIQASRPLDITKAKTCREAFPSYSEDEIKNCEDENKRADLIVTAVAVGVPAVIIGGVLTAPAVIPVVASATAVPGTVMGALGTGGLSAYVYITTTGQVLISKVPPVVQSGLKVAAVAAENGDYLMDAAAYTACLAESDFSACAKRHEPVSAMRGGGLSTIGAGAGGAAAKTEVQTEREVGGAESGLTGLWNSVKDRIGGLFGRGAKTTNSTASQVINGVEGSSDAGAGFGYPGLTRRVDDSVGLTDINKAVADAETDLAIGTEADLAKALDTKAPVVIKAPAGEELPVVAGGNRSGFPDLSKTELEIKFYDIPDYQIMLGDGSSYIVSPQAFDIEGRAVVSLRAEDGKVYMFYLSESENTFKHFIGATSEWIVKYPEYAMPKGYEDYTKVFENAPFEMDRSLRQMIGDGRIQVADEGKKGTLTILDQIGMKFDDSLLGKAEGMEVMQKRVRDFGVKAEAFDNNLLDNLKIDQPSSVVSNDLRRVNLYYDIKDASGRIVHVNVTLNSIAGEKYIGREGSKPLLIGISFADDVKTAFLGSPGVRRTEYGIKPLGSYEKAEKMILNSEIGQEFLRITSDKSIPDTQKAASLVKFVEGNTAVVKGVSAVANKSHIYTVLSADKLELEAKKKLVMQHLQKTGKIDLNFANEVSETEIIKSDVKKSREGYRFVTGRDGWVEGIIEKGRYVVSVDPLPRIDITIPSIIDTSKGSSVVLPVRVKKGNGQVEKISSTQANDTFGVVYAAEKTNNNSAIIKAVILSDDKVIPWAKVNIKLDKLVQEKKIGLNAGWNLITLSARPNQPLYASSFLGQIAQQGGYATTVSTLVDGAWKTYVARGDKDYTLKSDDFPIEEGKSYFVKALKKSDFTFEGQVFLAPVKLKLASGWNAVGFPKISKSYKVSDLLEVLNKNNADTLARWESGLWDTFVLLNKQKYGEDFAISGNRGYILKVDKEGEFAP